METILLYQTDSFHEETAQAVAIAAEKHDDCPLSFLNGASGNGKDV